LSRVRIELTAFRSFTVLDYETDALPTVLQFSSVRSVQKSSVTLTTNTRFSDTCLESAHVSRISGVLQAVLIAFHEEFQKEPADKNYKISLT